MQTPPSAIQILLQILSRSRVAPAGTQPPIPPGDVFVGHYLVVAGSLKAWAPMVISTTGFEMGTGWA